MDPGMMTTMEPGMMGTMEAIMTPTDPNTQTIADILTYQAGLETPEFTSLNQALQNAGLLDTLRDTSASYILFAPTDAAFAAASGGTTDMMSDTKTLLLNHVVSLSAQGTMATTVPGMMATQDMMATMEPGMMATMEPDMMGRCIAWTPDMMSAMDSGMMATMEPGAMATEDMMATMEPGMSATSDAGMSGTGMSTGTWQFTSLGGLTLWLENRDNCFTVNGVPVVAAVQASNGWIFVIDSVLTSDMSMMGTMEPGMSATSDAGMMATAEATTQP